MIRILFLLLLILIPTNNCIAQPLEGHIQNDPEFKTCQPNLDKRGKPLIGKIDRSFLRGLIGIRFNYETGEITYIYPESDLNRLGVKQGDFILRIEKEHFRPCLMPGVVIYPNGYILNLTIQTKTGQIKTVPVKLIPYKSILSTDS